MKRVALAKPDQGKPRPLDKPMPGNRISGIFGTGRIKTASGWQKRRQNLLIEPDN